jgi:hypothetical protein
MESVLTAPKGSEIQKKEVPLTVMVKDGNGFEVEVYNLEHPDNCPRTGIVVVELIKKKNYTADRDINMEISAYTDKTTGLMWGKYSGIDNISKEIRWKKIKLNPLNIFDRSIKDQAEKCAIVLNSPVVEGSRNAVYRLTFFRQHDKEIEANLKIKRIKAGQRALSIAESLYGEKLLQMARNLALPVTSMSLSMITAAVLEKAEQDPTGFLAIYDNPHYEALSVLNAAIEVAVIENDPQTGYLFKGRPMGTTEGEAIDFLVKHKDIQSSIDMQTKNRQSESIKAMATQEAVSTASDKDVEMALMRKQLAEQKALIEKMSAEGMKQVVEEEKGDADHIVKLKDRARALKIKAVHAYKSPEAIKKLEALVKAKEAELNK